MIIYIIIVYDGLVVKVNSIYTSEIVSKVQYNTGRWDIEKKVGGAEKKIPDTSGLVIK